MTQPGDRRRDADLPVATNRTTEVVAGVTTFFTMSYIVIVNPSILATEGTGMPFDGVLTATVAVCFLMTLLMGVYANLPFAIAPGMGINAFFTYTLVLRDGVPWPVALGIVFWAGVIFLAISATPLRETIARAIPRELRAAVRRAVLGSHKRLPLTSGGWAGAELDDRPFMDPIVFALIQGVLLRPLPVHEQDSLIVAWKEVRTSGSARYPFGNTEIESLAQASQLLDEWPIQW